MTNKITQKNIFNIGDLITLRPYDDPNIVSHISLTETEWNKYRNEGRGILKIVSFSNNGNIGVRDKTGELAYFDISAIIKVIPDKSKPLSNGVLGIADQEYSNDYSNISIALGAFNNHIKGQILTISTVKGLYIDFYETDYSIYQESFTPIKFEYPRTDEEEREYQRKEIEPIHDASNPKTCISKDPHPLASVDNFYILKHPLESNFPKKDNEDPYFFGIDEGQYKSFCESIHFIPNIDSAIISSYYLDKQYLKSIQLIPIEDGESLPKGTLVTSLLARPGNYILNGISSSDWQDYIFHKILMITDESDSFVTTNETIETAIRKIGLWRIKINKLESTFLPEEQLISHKYKSPEEEVFNKIWKSASERDLEIRSAKINSDDTLMKVDNAIHIKLKPVKKISLKCTD